jgi:hypothetical protein
LKNASVAVVVTVAAKGEIMIQVEKTFRRGKRRHRRK